MDGSSESRAQAFGSFGSGECPCIGFAGVDGTAMVRVGEHYVAYPGHVADSGLIWVDRIRCK